MGLRAVRPHVPDRPAIAAAHVDARERAGTSIEPGGEDQDVEFVLRAIGKPNTLRCHSLDRVAADVHQADILTIVRLVIVMAEWRTLAAQWVILRAEQL